MTSLQSILTLLGALLCASTAAHAQGRPASPVEVQTVESHEFTPTIAILGSAEPRRRSTVAASIEGYVVDFLALEGARVKTGAILARLRDTILELQLHEARAALDEVVERHKNAKRDLERAQKLVETDAITQKTLDERSTLERTLALRIPQARARVKILQANLDKKVVKAPYAGQVVREHTQIGEWVGRGGAVASLVDISSVYMRVNVPERFIRYLDDESVVQVWANAARTEPYKGKVVSIADEGDPKTRTFPVRVEIVNDGLLRASMSASVELPAGEKQTSVLVSKDAILVQGRLSYVYVVGENSISEQRYITTGASTGSSFAVVDGLQVGERVIVKGNERIRPGTPVRVVGDEERKSTGD